MNNNRCWFRASIWHEKIFKCNVIEVRMSDFYGCLKDSVQKPLSLCVRMPTEIQSHAGNDNEALADYYAKDTMHQLRQAVIHQVENFFEEFYHYNFADMRKAFKDCLELQPVEQQDSK